MHTGRAGILLGLLILSILALPGFALEAGKYTDYKYSSDYVPPSAPAEKTELTCEFFAISNKSCELLGLAPKSSREQVLFAMIRKTSPEENQDWVRFWNGKLQMTGYYEEAGDGEFGEDGALKNIWFRLIDFYPSVYDLKDNYTYLPSQVLLNIKSNIDFVVDNEHGEDICSQKYQIGGYDYEIKKQIGNYSTFGRILPVGQVLKPNEKANLTITMDVVGRLSYEVWKKRVERVCDSFGVCEDEEKCEQNITKEQENSVSLSKTWEIKLFPDAFHYDNRISVPKRGFAHGEARVTLPSDFLYYELRIKGNTLRVSRNDLRYATRGQSWPVLSLELVPAPSTQSSLRIISMNETDENGVYNATIRYKMFVENPDLADSDCTFIVATPFSTKKVESACKSTAMRPKITLSVDESEKYAEIIAKVTDRRGMPLEGVEVKFGGAISPQKRTTDENGEATISISRRESTETVTAKVVGSGDISEASSIIYISGRGASEGGRLAVPELLGGPGPILLLILLVSSAMAILYRRRTAWLIGAFFGLFALLALMPTLHAQAQGFDVQSTLDACRTYDFDNAVRHFGECSEAFRLLAEFESLKATVSVLITNIIPLVVANPDIGPYKDAYLSMTRIALSLFRVAWAFNSLYLILNVFNPVRRSQALKQYAWLIVFVIFVYASFVLLQDALTLVNTIAQRVIGPESAASLSESNMSVEFVAENYEMLKLMLPFLNLTYLVLLTRYIVVIGTMLFFPFTLLLFFTSATRGFGRAALTVTFASLGLGVVNAVLLLIYDILTKTSDPVLSSTFSTTFFSASFLIFFGFANLLILSIAFLSGIIFIGQGRKE